MASRLHVPAPYDCIDILRARVGFDNFWFIDIATHLLHDSTYSDFLIDPCTSVFSVYMYHDTPCIGIV